jgi:hypothetical protein
MVTSRPPKWAPCWRRRPITFREGPARSISWRGFHSVDSSPRRPEVRVIVQGTEFCFLGVGAGVPPGDGLHGRFKLFISYVHLVGRQRDLELGGVVRCREPIASSAGGPRRHPPHPMGGERGSLEVGSYSSRGRRGGVWTWPRALSLVSLLSQPHGPSSTCQCRRASKHSVLPYWRIGALGLTAKIHGRTECLRVQGIKLKAGRRLRRGFDFCARSGKSLQQGYPTVNARKWHLDQAA